MNSLYLKYRPKILSDLVGQNHVVSTLKQSKISNRFSHAYLFVGKHGCGKTSAARILASMVACENDEQAQKVLAGMSLDVKELDGATNGSVENIRTLIDGARWFPQELSKKVYIIDEAHQLSKEAITALLKIIEEPPDYLTFILCTTEGKKILPTIASRCQRFNFHHIASKDIVGRLTHIADNEGIKISDDALYMLAKSSRGSMRDAIGLLEHMGIIAGDRKIFPKHIQKFFGIPSATGCIRIANSIVDCDISKLLDQINDLVVTSGDAKEILVDVSEVFRNTMILKAQKGDTKLLDLPDNEIEELKELSNKIKLVKLSKMAGFFSDVGQKMDFNINNRWILESTLIDCAAFLRS